jgi:hypothetical protein
MFIMCIMPIQAVLRFAVLCHESEILAGCSPTTGVELKGHSNSKECIRKNTRAHEEVLHNQCITHYWVSVMKCIRENPGNANSFPTRIDYQYLNDRCLVATLQNLRVNKNSTNRPDFRSQLSTVHRTVETD